MYGDFSRLTFNEADNFAAVWSQQGREQVDSDLNELTAIMLDHLRRLTVDVLGPFAAAYPGSAFTVSADADEPNDLWIETGDYYVHGLRCRLVEQDNSGLTTRVRYRHHAGLHGVPPLPEPPFLVQLVVWEQTVTARQRPRLLDPGLGPFPPDSLRTAVRFHLQTSDTRPDGAAVTGDETAAEISALYVSHNDGTALPADRPRLRARTRRQAESDDPTAQLPVRQGYRRPENQLYRIEVHTGGTAQADATPTSWSGKKTSGPDQATFTYSRDNASVQFAVLHLDQSSDGQLAATLADTGYDEHTDLDEGDWVELRDDSWSPLVDPLPLLQVVRAERGVNLVVLAGPDGFDPGSHGDSLHPYLIRWDQRFDVTAADNAVAIPTDDAKVLEDGWLELEDGLQIRFDQPDAEYRAGDYWLIPARSATGGLLWPHDPSGGPASVQASRPIVLRAPLAVVTELNKDGVRDLRNFGGRLVNAAVTRAASLTGASGSDPAAAKNGGDVGTESSTGVMPAAADAGDQTTDTTDSTDATDAINAEDGEDASDSGLGGDKTILTRTRLSTTSQGQVAGTTPVRMVRLTVQAYEAKPDDFPMQAGWTQDLGLGRYTIGRGMGQSIRLTDGSVSGTHAMIEVAADGCHVWDTGGPNKAGSTNGTWLLRDGQVSQIFESVSLDEDDIVRFGAVPMRVNFL